MIDWTRLARDMHIIAARLVIMMTEEAIPEITTGVMRDVESWPSVAIGYETSGGQKFQVRLSVEDAEDE